MQTIIMSVQREKNLSIVELKTEYQNTFEYITGSKGITEGFVEVREVDADGSVNNLHVFNLSEQYIFFSEGDLLQGAKQNRVLNASVLLAPHSKTTLPVSCVEQGRWNSVSKKFSSVDLVIPPIMRTSISQDVKRNLDFEEGHKSDQDKVWDEVLTSMRVANIYSETCNFTDILKSEKYDADLYNDKFKPTNGANGIALFVNNLLIGIDIYNRTDVYKEYFPKIIRSVVIEGLNKETKTDTNDAELKYRTLDMIYKLETLPTDKHPGVGVGEELRFNDKSVTGFFLNFSDKIIHLAGLNSTKN